MADESNPAAAGPEPVSEPKPKAKAKQTITVKGVRLTKIQRGSQRFPAAIYRGDTPSKGDTLRFTLPNGITYAGEVIDATEADGEVLAEFKNGLKPINKQES